MAREWQSEAKRVHDQKFVEGAEAEEDLLRCNQAHTRKERSARETRQDRDP